MAVPVNPIAAGRRLPPGFWEKRANRHAFLDWLGHVSGFRRTQDWYQLEVQLLKAHRAMGLVRWCGHSLPRLLADYRPRYDWKPWLFQRVAPGYWLERDNRVAYVDWLGEQLGYEDPEDWYQHDAATLYEMGAAMLLKKTGGAYYPLMMDYMPDYDWKPWFFREVPAGYWDVYENRLEYLTWLGRELGFEKPEDWYHLSTQDVSESGGGVLLQRFGFVAGLVKSHFPDYEWLDWRFNISLYRFWEDDDNCRRYLAWLADELGFVEADDWYALRKRMLKKNHGAVLYERFGSVRAIARFLYPDHDWLEWRFAATPEGFWWDPACRRRYLDWLGEELGFSAMEDWYGLTLEHLAENYGSTLSRIYGGRIRLILTESYPEYEWLEWRFARTSDDFWGRRENCLRFLDWLAERLGFKTLDDWYRVQTRDFVEHAGWGVLTRYGSYSEVLKVCYPDHEWKEWLFGRAPSAFWNDEDNCRRYLEWLGGELGVETMEDWYRLTIAELIRRHGDSLTRRWRTSHALLSHFFPDYDWKEWLFHQVPKGFWDDPRCRRRYLDWLGRELGFRRPEDWHRLTIRQVMDHRGGGLISRLGGVLEILREYRPDHDWKEWLLKPTPRGFWRNRDARRRYLVWLGEELGFRQPSDWCRLTNSHFDSSQGHSLRKMYSSSVDAVLRSAFPADHPILLARRAGRR